MLSLGKLDTLMKPKFFTAVVVSFLTANPCMAAEQQLYCPQHSGYISVGMTEEQVLGACGAPLSKQSPNTPVTEKVPVTQLIYSSLNSGGAYQGLNSAYYNQWSLPSGTSGIVLQVSIINNKVSAINMSNSNDNSLNVKNTNVSTIQISGANTNAASICGGGSLNVGDDVNKVYSACGSPTMTNTSYINQVIPSSNKPEVWIYQIDKYHSPFSLTFVNGKLQSIN